MTVPTHHLASTKVGAKLAAITAEDFAGRTILNYLIDRGVSDEVAAARGYGITDGTVDLPEVGLPAGARKWFDEGMAYALTIPLISPAGETATVQMRYDGEGLPRPDGSHAKFATPPKVPRRNKRAGIPADIHPLARPYLDDKTVPVMITEGVVKADAVLSAARAEGTPLVTMAITGVTMLADSSRNGGRTVLHPESWGELAHSFEGRTVILAWDADARSKKPVTRALQTAAHALSNAGADVRVWIAPVEAGAKAGIDDWLVGEKARKARQPIAKGLIGKAAPWAKVEAELSKARLVWTARTPRPIEKIDLAALLDAPRFDDALDEAGLWIMAAPALPDDGYFDGEARQIVGWTTEDRGESPESTIDAVVAIDEKGGQSLLARTDAGRGALGGAHAWGVVECITHLILDGDAQRAEAIVAKVERAGTITTDALLAALDRADSEPQTVADALVALRNGEDNDLPFESQDGTRFVAKFSTDPREHGWWEAVERPVPGGFGTAPVLVRRTAWLAGVVESTTTRIVNVGGGTEGADKDRHVVRVILPGGRTVSTGQMDPRNAGNPVEVVNAVMSTAAIEGPASPAEATPMRKMLSLFGREERKNKVIVSRCGWVRFGGEWAYVTPTGAIRASGWDPAISAAPAADPTALVGMSPYVRALGFAGVAGKGCTADLADWASDFAALAPARPMVTRILLAAFFGSFLPSTVRPAISLAGKEGSGKTALYRALAATLVTEEFAAGREPLAAVKVDADSESASTIAAGFLGEAPVFSDDFRRDQNAPERTRAMARLVDSLITASADQAGGARFESAGRARRTDVLGVLFLSGEIMEMNRSRADRTIALRLHQGDLDQRALDAYRSKWLATGRARGAIYEWLLAAVIARNSEPSAFTGFAVAVSAQLADETDSSRATQTSARGVLQGIAALRMFAKDAPWGSLDGSTWVATVGGAAKVADDAAAAAIVAEIRDLAGAAKSVSDPGRDLVDELRDGLAAGRYYLRAADGSDIADFIATECGWRWSGAKDQNGVPIASFHTLPGAVEVGRISDPNDAGVRRIYLQAGSLAAIRRAAGVELRKGAETDDALGPFLLPGSKPGNVGWLRTAAGAKTTGYGYQFDAAGMGVGVSLLPKAVSPTF
ncbi:DUF3854 domain-containing protein [Microbacterium lacus]|uniref:DUF3854 domain-containing protein n=1 Tax=Microbacterium lacus TaxID=415217 RepID=UPI00384C947B